MNEDSSNAVEIQSKKGNPLRQIPYEALRLLRHAYFVRRPYLYLEREFLKHNRLLNNPVLVKINTAYVCNLRCPLCPTGRRSVPDKKTLTLEGARFILSRLKGVHSASLFGWGESFLTKDIFPIIAMFQKRRIYLSVDSNLSIKDEAIVERIGRSGIDFLSVSLDGVDQASYGQYRFGGSFDLAYRNMIRLWNSPHGPHKMQWQYIVSKKNIQHLEKARTMAREAGIPFLSFDIGLYMEMFCESSKAVKEEWWTDEQRARLDACAEAIPASPCMYMYNEPFIDTDGQVYPCCHAPHAPQSLLARGYQNVFGDLWENTLEEIWNNEYYQTMRARFAGRRCAGSEVKPICLRCRLYLRTQSPDYAAKMPLFDGQKVIEPEITQQNQAERGCKVHD